MNCESARNLLTSRGFAVVAINRIEEGANHDVFEVLMPNRKMGVLKCLLKNNGRDLESDKDSLFDGPKSLNRQIQIFDVIRNSSAVRVPEIYDSDNESFMFVEKLDGSLWANYLLDNDFDKNKYLYSLKKLGEAFADLQKRKFSAFGDLLAEDQLGNAVTNYADRFLNVLSFRLKSAVLKGAVSETEAKKINEVLSEGVKKYHSNLEVDRCDAVIVLDDMHSLNFFVDDKGESPAFFDVEFAQSAHPSLEYYSLCLFLFNYFDDNIFIEAQESFSTGYLEAGGVCDFKGKMFTDLTDFSTISRFVELSCSYYGVKDGLRDGWSLAYKSLIDTWLNTGELDYLKAGDVQRKKMDQPKTPN